MRVSPPLTVAVSLNIVLAAALLLSHYSRPRSSGAAADSSAATASGAAMEDDPAKLFAWATQRGASDRLGYRLALAAARAATAKTVPDEYWKPVPERAVASRAAEFGSMQATRQLLLESFGPAAKEQPAFAEVFQPYRARFPFLSTDKQMALQQILFESSSAGQVFGRPAVNADDPRSTRIRALLSEEEFAEYQRRESPLAMQLANIGFDFTEQEFRAVHDAVDAARRQQPAVRQPLLVAMRDIESALGASRFQEFRRAQDPIYSWLRVGAREFGVTHETVVAAYDLIKDTQQKAAGLSEGASGKLFAARDRELKAQLGARMFAYVAPRLENGRPRSSWAGDPATAFRPTR